MIYYVYSLTPCDYWGAFLPVKEYVAKSDDLGVGDCDYDAAAWLDKMRMIAAHATYWEGNPHTECVSALPSVDYEPIRIYSAKQSNNGTTFVVSPVPLWHLHQSPIYSEREMRDMVDVKIVELAEAEL